MQIAPRDNLQSQGAINRGVNLIKVRAAGRVAQLLMGLELTDAMRDGHYPYRISFAMGQCFSQFHVHVGEFRFRRTNS